MRLRSLIPTFFLLTLPAWGQQCSIYAGKPIQNLGGGPVSGASVRVCQSGASGATCSPLATIYSDSACTHSIPASTLTTDSNGAWSFYCSPGLYVIQPSFGGVIITYTDACPAISTSGTVVLPNTQIAVGTGTSVTGYSGLTFNPNTVTFTVGGTGNFNTVGLVAGGSALAFSTPATFSGIADLGAGNVGVLFSDNSTGSGGDHTINTLFDTGSTNLSLHAPFQTRIQGINQLTVCEMPGPEGATVIGNALIDSSTKLPCPVLTTNPFAKFVVMSKTAAHTITRLYQQSNAATGNMLEMNNVTAAGTGWNFWQANAGCSAADSSCSSGTQPASLRGDGQGTFDSLVVSGTNSCPGCAGQMILNPGTSAGTPASGVGFMGPATVTTPYNLIPGGAPPSAFTTVNISSTGQLIYAYPPPLAFILQTVQTGAISTSTLCTAAVCSVTGQYHVSWNMWQSGTLCSAAGSVAFNLTWTDEAGISRTVTLLGFVANSGTSTASQSSTMALNATGNGNASIGGDFSFSTNGTIIQYSTTYTACPTGTGTYNLRATVIP